MSPMDWFTIPWSKGGWQEPTEEEKESIKKEEMEKNIKKLNIKREKFLQANRQSNINLSRPKIHVFLSNAFKSPAGIYSYENIRWGVNSDKERAREQAEGDGYSIDGKRVDQKLQSLIDSGEQQSLITFNLHDENSGFEYSNRFANKWIAFTITVVANGAEGDNVTEYPRKVYKGDEIFYYKVPNKYEDTLIDESVEVVEQTAETKPGMVEITQKMTFERAFNLGLHESIASFYKPRAYKLILSNYGVPKGTGVYKNISFEDGDFTGSDFTNCQFVKCNFKGANLTNAKILNYIYKL